MISPRGKLLFWAGMAVPFAAIGAIAPSAALPSAAAAGILLAVIIADALTSRGSLEGISVEFPEVLRVSKNHEAYIDIRIRNPKAGKRRLRMGLPFPKDIVSNDEDMLVELPENGGASHFSWQCKPLKRGSYFFEECYIEGYSFLGLWAVRAARPARLEIRVYPDLSFERKNLAALFLNRGNFGIHAQRHTGHGRDFEKLREYIRGDSFEQIHWKATAKRGHPITKVFQIERTQEVYVIVDASRLSGRVLDAAGGDNDEYPETVLERFITAALVMGVAARRQGDFFGVLSFSDTVHSFIRAKGGRVHYNSCRDALYKLQPRLVTPDFDELCAFIGLRLRRRALLIFLTGLDDPALSESFVRNMEMIRRKHLVLVGTIKPERTRPLFSSSDISSLDDVYQSLGGHILWHDLLELGKVLQRKNVLLMPLSSEKLCSRLVSQYMDVKQRQLI